jgi:hypothetical protein
MDILAELVKKVDYWNELAVHNKTLSFMTGKGKAQGNLAEDDGTGSGYSADGNGGRGNGGRGGRGDKGKGGRGNGGRGTGTSFNSLD